MYMHGIMDDGAGTPVRVRIPACDLVSIWLVESPSQRLTLYNYVLCTRTYLGKTVGK